MTKEGAYEVRKVGLKAKARITVVKTKKASEIYGQKTKTPNQLLIEITANVNYNDLNAPFKVWMMLHAVTWSCRFNL